MIHDCYGATIIATCIHISYPICFVFVCITAKQKPIFGAVVHCTTILHFNIALKCTVEYLCLYLSASKYQRPPLLHQSIDQLVYSVDSQCSAIRIALAVALKYTVWSILLNFSHIFSHITLKCSQMRCILKVIKNALYYSISPQNVLHCIKMHIATIR